MSNTLALTDQDKSIVRIAAHGAVALVSAASSTPHKTATAGGNALYSATGPVGHVIATAKAKDIKLKGKTVAELADQVLPALTAAVQLLEQQDPAEADNFRSTVQVAIASAQAHQAQPSPTVVAMADKITAALG